MQSARGFGSGLLKRIKIMDYGYNVVRHSSDGLDLYRVGPAGTPAIPGVTATWTALDDCTEAMGREFLSELQEAIGGDLVTVDGYHCLAVTCRSGFTPARVDPNELPPFGQY